MLRNPLGLACKLACLVLGAFVVLGIVRLAKAEDPAEDLAAARTASLEAARDFIPTGGDAPTDEDESEDTEDTDADAPADGESTESTEAGSVSKDSSKDSASKDGASKDDATKGTTAKTAKKNDDKVKAADAPEALSHVFSKFLFDKKPPKKVKPIVLEGIGGGFAFITAPNGRSGLVGVGETFQGIRVLKIAQNRVLIEYKGEKSELNIWNGLGSEPLIEKKAPAKKTKAGSTKVAAPGKAAPPTKTPTPEASPGGKK